MELSTVEHVWDYLRQLGPNQRVTTRSIIDNKKTHEGESLSQGAVAGATNRLRKAGFLRISKKSWPIEYEITSLINKTKPRFYAKPIEHEKSRAKGHKRFKIPNAEVVDVTVPCPQEISKAIGSVRQSIRNKVDEVVDKLINLESMMSKLDVLEAQIAKINTSINLEKVDDVSLAREMKRRREGGLRIGSDLQIRHTK